jgi:hypothetical protein
MTTEPPLTPDGRDDRHSPIDREDAVEVAQYLGPRLSARVGLDVWTRVESGLLRTDRDTCTHCDDAADLARQLASLHPALSVTRYDLERHASRAEEARVTQVPATIVRGSGRSIRLVGLFAGLLFPAYLDLIWFVSQRDSPLTDESRAGLAALGDTPIEIEALLAPYDPYSVHMARLLGAFAVQHRPIHLQLVELSEFPVLAGQRAVTEIPVMTINGRRFSGAWEEAPLLQQIQRVLDGNDEPAIRDRVFTSPFLTEEQAIQRAREEWQREQGGAAAMASPSGVSSGLDAPGGLIIPGR